jgi:hypothetical protein
VSTLKVNNLQVGQDGTAANNYTLYQPASPDGTVRLGYGVAGSVTDILTLKDSKLGIGQNSPGSRLDVNGLTKSGGFQANDNVTPTAGHGVEIFASSSSQGMIQAFDRTNGSQMELKFRGSDITFFGTSSADERVRITGAGLVGIGTDNPATLLHLEAGWPKQTIKSTNLNTAGSLVFDVNNVNTADFLLGQIASKWNGTDVAYINFEAGADTTNKDDGLITFNTSASGGSPQERLRITPAGDVGIGDDDPSDALTVYKTNVGNPVGITIRNTEASSTYSHARLKLESQNGAAYAHLWADVANTALRLGYNSSSTVNIYDNGRLTSPNQITAGTTFGIANVSGSIAGSGGGQDYIGLRHGTTFGLMLKTAGTNVGSVGIGVVDPGVQLDVKRATAGTIARFYDTGSNGGALYNGGPIVGLSRVSNGSVSLDGPLFQVGIDKNSTSTYNIDETVFCVANDGVGIGTDNPNEELHIHANGTSYVRFTDEASGTGATDGVVFGLDHPHLYAWNYEAGDFVVATNATEKLRVRQNYIRTGGGSQTSNNGFIPLTFYSSASLGTGYRHGISTTFLGQISPGNVGNAYLHAKIDVPGGAMWWVHSWGYTYSGGAIHNSQAVGYTYGSSIIATSVINQNSNRGLHVYRATDGNLVMRIYAAHGTGNAWGYFAFEGGFDGIVGNKPDHTLRILAYTWSASSAAQY